jgi:preprotein translocase subunit SecG
MFTFLVTLIVIFALLLVLVVLAQNSKGGGLSSQFGGSGASQVMGVKKTGDILEKLTWVFAIAIMVLVLATNPVLTGADEAAGFTSPTIERAQEQNVLPGMNNQLPLEGTTGDSALIEDDELLNLAPENAEQP